MAKKKKLNLFENPPSSSSSDEEDTQQHNSSDDDSSSSSDEEEEDDLMNPVKVSSGKKPKSLSAAAVSRKTAVSSAANQPSKSDPGSEKPDENHASTAAKTINKSKERLDSPSAKSTKKPKEGRSSTAMKSCSAAVPGLTTTSSAAVKSKGKEPVEISPSPAIPGQTTTSAAVKSKGKESAEKPPPIAVPVKTATVVKLSEPEMVKAKEKEIRGSMKSGKETAEISPSPAIPRQTTTSSAVKSKGKEPTEKPPPVAVPVKTAVKLLEPISLKAKEKEVHVPVKSGKKRTSENTSKDIDNLKRTKKKKKKKVSEEDMINIVSDTKKPMFQRLFSEEDEISLLQGMIDFKTDTGKSPFQDMNTFYESAKKTISFDATKSQFVHKIGSLKRKYLRKLYKGLDSFRDDHDKECLKLANYIWGSYEIASRNGQKIEEEDEQVSEEDQESLGAKIAYWFDDILVGSAEKSNARPGMSEKKPDSVEGNSDKVEEDKEVFGNERDWFEDSFVVGSVVGLGVNGKFMKRKWKEAPMETRKRIEEKLKSLHAKEMEVVAEKTDIMNEVSSMIAK